MKQNSDISNRVKMNAFANLIFSLVWSFSVVANADRIYFHTDSVQEKVFLENTAQIHGQSFVEFFLAQKSVQDFNQIEIDDNPKHLITSLKLMIARPITQEDIEIWLQIYSKLPQGKWPLEIQNLARSFLSIHSEIDSNANSSASFRNQDFSANCSGFWMVDGLKISVADFPAFLRKLDPVSTHQWNLISNCHKPVTFLQTSDNFRIDLAKIVPLNNGDQDDLQIWGRNFKLMKNLDAGEIPVYGSDFPMEPSRSASKGSDGKMAWVVPIVLGVAGLTAYELRDKDVTVKWPSFSFK